ncbi:hypothetical protein LVJ94_28125 [Pendulispora rubella]|uniref:TonB C-terminal domain-containing protein n=1 Tax=Pendulispora rubella TaxID=2741070 RepID=A0ABZ2KTA6_9BACT
MRDAYRTPWRPEENAPPPKGSLLPGTALFVLLAGVALGGTCIRVSIPRPSQPEAAVSASVADEESSSSVAPVGEEPDVRTWKCLEGQHADFHWRDCLPHDGWTPMVFEPQESPCIRESRSPCGCTRCRPGRWSGFGMVRPQLIKGEANLSPEICISAPDERQLAIAKCTIGENGHVSNCRFVRGEPELKDRILSNLTARRYTPVFLQEKPVSVNYTFVFRIPACPP